MNPEHTPKPFYEGRTGHFRNGPVQHGFTYRVFFLGMDIDTLDQCLNAERSIRPKWPWLFSVNGLNLLAFSHSSHGPRDGSALGPWIRNILREAQLPDYCGHTITLHTFPKILGWGFSPVSFWLCRDREGQLRAMLAEVNNTFGEHHSYLVAHDDAAVIEGSKPLSAIKVFHVSPFFPVAGQYQFQIQCSTPNLHIRIQYKDGQGNDLIAYLQGRGSAMSGLALLVSFLKHPFQNITVLSRIHWHALLLWRKGVRFHRKPAPPREEISVERH